MKKLINKILGRIFRLQVLSSDHVAGLQADYNQIQGIKHENKTLKSEQSRAFLMNSARVGRLLYFNELFEMAREVPGDIVECGVGKGESLTMLCNILKSRREHRHVWAFDSFEGFPEPSGEDVSDRNTKKGEVAYDAYWVQRTVTPYIADELFMFNNLTFVKGFFDKTLENPPMDKISLLHLDVDLYESYKTCLEKLWDKVSPGGVITFDEYIREGYAFPGAIPAIDNFAAEKGQQLIRGNFGKYYLVKS